MPFLNKQNKKTNSQNYHKLTLIILTNKNKKPNILLKLTNIQTLTNLQLNSIILSLLIITFIQK